MSGELLPLPEGSDPLGLFVGSLPFPQQNGIFPVTQTNVDAAVAIALQQLPKQPILTPTSIQVAAYPAPQMNDLVRIDASLGPVAQPMPRALSVGSFAVKKTDATTNPVTVTATGTDTVDGLFTVTLRLQGEVKTFISIPGGWVTANGMNTVAATDLRYIRSINGNTPSPSTGDVTVPIAGSATVSVQGLVKLAGDLGGSADFPTVPGLSSKADLVGGKIVSSQIPSLALTTAVPVASQAAMLALTSTQVQPGDLALRADGAGTFMLMAADPSILSNWTLLPAPTDAVVSVNGQIGAVVFSATSIGAASVTSVNTEVARATAAESTNSTSITNETNRATAAENTKAATTALTAETTRATNAENTNTTAINNEVTRATAAEATNAAAITTEKNRAMAAEAAVMTFPAMGVKVNGLMSPYGSYGESNTGMSYTLGKMYFVPFFFPNSITIDQASYDLSGGTAGAVFALWKPDADGLPSTLLANLGAATVAFPGLTTAAPVVVPVGLVWASIVLTAANGNIYSMNNSFITSPGSSPVSVSMINGNNYSQYLSTTENTYNVGAPPATLPTPPVATYYTAVAGSTPYILLRRSA